MCTQWAWIVYNIWISSLWIRTEQSQGLSYSMTLYEFRRYFKAWEYINYFFHLSVPINYLFTRVLFIKSTSCWGTQKQNIAVLFITTWDKLRAESRKTGTMGDPRLCFRQITTNLLTIDKQSTLKTMGILLLGVHFLDGCTFCFTCSLVDI